MINVFHEQVCISWLPFEDYLVVGIADNYSDLACVDGSPLMEFEMGLIALHQFHGDEP